MSAEFNVVNRMIRLLALLALSLSFPVMAAAADCSASISWENCRIYIQGAWLEISNRGLLKLGDKSTQLTLPAGFYIESVKYENSGAGTVMSLEVTDIEGSFTLLALVDMTRRKLRWSAEVGFNASPVLVTDSALYVGAIGMVAKINLHDGRIVWEHRDLYERDTQAFNSFIRPRKEAKTIVFVEAKVGWYNGVREVSVDDVSGKLLSK